MKFGKKLFIGFIFLELVLPTKGFSMMPVIDSAAISNLIKNYNQLKTQYTLLSQTYENAQSQLDKQRQLVSDVEGHYGFGSLMNSASDLQNREWSPDSWKDTLSGLSGGNPDRYQELLNTYETAHPSLSQNDYEAGSSEEQATRYVEDIQVNRAAVVNATYSFDEIKTHIETIHTLSTQIDEAENTKAATDLNSRLLAEVAYIQAQELKMQVVLNQQIAQSQADTISSKTASAVFNTLPE